MNSIAYMKEELERLDIKAELLDEVSIVSLYDSELEKTICYANVVDKEKLHVYIPYTVTCVCNFIDRLSLDQLKEEVQANTKKRIRKLVSEYGRARKNYVQTCRDCESMMRRFNRSINDYRIYELDYKVKSLAYRMKKELGMIARQAYEINKLGE